MDTQLDRCPHASDERSAQATLDGGEFGGFLGLAGRYLHHALQDQDLSDDEEAVLKALHDLPDETPITRAGAALNRYVTSAQISEQRMTHEESSLIVELAHQIKQHPEGDLPGLDSLLELINNIVNNATTDRPLTPTEAEVVKLLLDIVRSGQLDPAAIDQLLAQTSRLALEGASVSDTLYSGLDAHDLATLRQEARAGGYTGSAEPPPTHPGDPILSALLKAGMTLPDATRLATTVSQDEIRLESFTSMLQQRLQKGDTADDALVWARYQGVASEAELSNAQFRADLTEARHLHPDKTPEDHVHEARCLVLYRHLGAIVSLDTLREQDPKLVQMLLAQEPAILKILLKASTSLPDTATLAATLTPVEARSPEFIKILNDKLAAGLPPQEALAWARIGPQVPPETLERFLALGLTLTQCTELSAEQRTALLDADINIVKLLLGAGMTPADVATYATAVSGLELTPEFVEKIRQSISERTPSGGAIAFARYGNLISQAELRSADFTDRLLFPDQHGTPPSQGPIATSLIFALSFARSYFDIFEAAEKLAVDTSDPHDGKFDSTGVFKLADLSTESTEWVAIESTLGRTVSTEERQAAISSAQSMKDNWATLCSMAGALNLHLREGTTDVIDFTSDHLRELNVSPLIAMLGNTPATLTSPSMNLLSALDHLRQHVDLYEAAEQVAVSESDAHDGRFDQAGVKELASLEMESGEWQQIEDILGHEVSLEDRASAMSAAQGLMENWTQLCENASVIGLQLREGTTNIIEFRQDTLGQLNFGPLVGLLKQPLVVDQLNNLRHARAHAIVQHLGEAEARSTVGVDLSSVLDLDLTATGAQQLLSLAPQTVRALLGQGGSLGEIASLSPEKANAVIAAGPELTGWLTESLGATLAEIGNLHPSEVGILQANRLAGYRPATSDEIISDIKPETVGYPMDLAGGALAFETRSGQKIVVTQRSNSSLYNEALGLLLDRSKSKVQELRVQHGLPSEAEVDVAQLATTVQVNPDDPSAGFYAVGDLAFKNLVDGYRGGFVMRHGTLTTTDSVVIYKLDDGSQIAIDKDQLKSDQARQTLDKLVTGQAVSEKDLKDLESDKGSDNLFEGDDWDTWTRFTTPLSSTDPRADLVRAFEARNALAEGYELLPYYESPNGFGGTHRTYRGGESAPNFQTVTPADLRQIFNEGAINNHIDELMARPAIQTAYQSAMASALEHLPNRQKIADSLYEVLTGPKYFETLKAFKDSNLAYEAEQMAQRDLTSLALLDPERAVDAAQKLRISALGTEYEEIINNPSLIDDESFTIAMSDSVAIFLQSLRSTSGIARHVSGALLEAIEGLKAQHLHSLGKVIKTFVAGIRTNHAPGLDLKALTKLDKQAFINALDEHKVPLSQRGSLTRFFLEAQKAGVWGTIAGAGALASFGYRLGKGAWGPNSTPLERWGAARDLLSFLSVSSHVAKVVASGFDPLLNPNLAKMEDGLIWKFMGLDRTLPELWKGKTPLPSSSRLAQESIDELRKMLSDYDKSAASLVGQLDNAVGSRAPSAAITKIEADLIRDALPLGGTSRRVGLSVFKTLGTVTDLVGIADIVVGAIGLKKAIKNHDHGMIVAHSLGIAGGASLTAAGVIGTVGLVTRVASVASTFFLAGTVFSLGGYIATLITGAIKRHNQLQDSTDKQGEWFKHFADKGMAYADWAEKLEYLRYAYSWYGNDNPNPSQAYFDFQKAEWENFQNTPQADGSSLNRLNSSLHVYTDKTLEPPFDDARLEDF